MSQGITRRRFLKGAAIGAGVIVLTGRFRANAYAANTALNTALVGVGGQGAASHGAAVGENLVALCDVDETRMGDFAGQHPKAKTYTDFRRLFDKHRDVQATFIATPDHSHFPAAMAAISRGSGVYVEKPLTHSIWEARTLARAARRANVATQMGNQGHSNEGWRVLCEYVWSGRLGNVTEVHCATNRPLWAQNCDRPASRSVPAGLNWDAWIGTAPHRDFHEGLHPFAWRGWRDFGCGALGDMACHIMDGAFWALKLGEAASCTVEAEFEGGNRETFPAWSVLTYQFPARGDMPPVTVKWFDGGKLPPRPKELEPGRKVDEGGHSFFYGDKAAMMADCYGRSVRVIPESQHREIPPPEKTIPRAGDHRGRRNSNRAARSMREAIRSSTATRPS